MVMQRYTRSTFSFSFIKIMALYATFAAYNAVIFVLFDTPTKTHSCM